MFYIFSTIFHCYYNNYPYLCKKIWDPCDMVKVFTLICFSRLVFK